VDRASDARRHWQARQACHRRQPTGAASATTGLKSSWPMSDFFWAKR